MTNEDLSGDDSKLLPLTQPKTNKNGKKTPGNAQAMHMAWETAP